MTPDLVYFVPLSVERVQSHSVLGLFWVCLPLGLLSLALFYLVFSPLLVAISPRALANRLPQTWRDGKLPRLPMLLTAFSVLIGAATHLVWDSFTHANEVPVSLVPILKDPLLDIGGYTVYGYKVLQHASTLIGVALLFFWGRIWYQHTQPNSNDEALPIGYRVILIGLLIVPATVVGTTLGLDSVPTNAGILAQLRAFLEPAIFAGGTTFLACALLTGIGYRITMRVKA